MNVRQSLRLGILARQQFAFVAFEVARVFGRQLCLTARFVEDLSILIGELETDHAGVPFLGNLSSSADQPVEDGQRSSVAVPHLQRQLPDEAMSAEYLQPLIGNSHRRVGGEKLSESGATDRGGLGVQFGCGLQSHPSHGT